MSARITVVVPFHSGVDWLGEALSSLRAQDVPDWRAVVLDDRGEDADVASFAARLGDPRITVVTNPRTLGMVANWNRALEIAETELVSLLHADDRLLPGYVRTVTALAEANPGAVATFCGARIIGPDGTPGHSLADTVKAWLTPRGEPLRIAGEPGLRALARADFVFCPTLCFRRSVLGPRRFDPRWRQVQDLDLLARLVLDGLELVGTHTVAYEYRRHPASATAQQSGSQLRFQEELAVLDEIAEAAHARGWWRAERTARRKAVVRAHLLVHAARELAAGRPRATLGALALAARGRPAPGLAQRRPGEPGA